MRGASWTRAIDPYFKATRKADEIVNVKRDPGITGTRMTLSDKVVKTKMSDVDKERGLGKKTKTKKTPETKASVKKRGHGLTFKASQEKVKDIKNINPKDIPKVKKSREINIEAPATVRVSFILAAPTISAVVDTLNAPITFVSPVVISPYSH